ncbi:MAG: MipA/OmpV family protein [Burkholderiales bacterium]|jgi:outer membrane protein
MSLLPARAVMTAALLALLLFSARAHAQLEPLFETMDLKTGSTAVGVAVQTATSPYESVGQVMDLMPIYVYEGEMFYLHSYRAGFKLPVTEGLKFDVFISSRFEGFPYDEIPESLADMQPRNPGLDGGLALRYSSPVGDFALQFTNDISTESNGSEFIAGYGFKWRHGRFLWHPFVRVAFRDTDLNDYYYGVHEDEATPERAAYEAGDGYNFEFGLSTNYRISRNWRLLAGVAAERLSNEIQDSPIVDKSWLVSGYVGAQYQFEDQPDPFGQRKPLLVRVFHGASTDCLLNQLITFRCASIAEEDDSTITGVHLGRTFVERVNDWPLDFVGYVGALYRKDNESYPDSWQIDAYMKPYWYGFPWSDTLGTRIGFGIGLSYSSQVPYTEYRDQTVDGENTSKLLNYLDPSIEINVGDLFRSMRMRETWLGVGVSHRSGAFGSSQLLGNVYGGSNYIYASIEAAF